MHWLRGESVSETGNTRRQTSSQMGISTAIGVGDRPLNQALRQFDWLPLSLTPCRVLCLYLCVDCFPFHLFIGLTSLCCEACGSDSPVKIIDNNVNKFLRKFALRFAGILVEPPAAVSACWWTCWAQLLAISFAAGVQVINVCDQLL